MRRSLARPPSKPVVATAALSLLVAACGDNNAEDEATVVDPIEEGVDDVGQAQDIDEELLTAIEAYGRTVVDGDPDALTAARSAGCTVVDTDLPATPAGEDAADIDIKDVEADVDGDEATVDYRIDPAGEQISDERWVREDGKWKWDNC